MFATCLNYKMLSSFCLLLYFSAAASLEMNDIMKELSWRLKLKILNPAMEPPKIAHTKPEVSPEPPARKIIISATTESDLTTNQEPHSSSGVGFGRKVGIQLLKSAQRRDEPDPNRDIKTDDDKNMRLKLFRLMYETVRDSDLKVKRAELIKDHYTNSSAFEMGYLIGDITDKYNIITDISKTLKKFQREWKPIEHINAYEQIANQAIEITHLIDLVRIVHKKETETKS